MARLVKTPPANEVVLQIGEFYFGGGRTKVRTLLGSCVSITLWQPRLKIGGMCHYLLPRRGASEAALTAPQGNYAEGAMQMFLREVSQRGTRPEDYVVKLFGGGSMFIDANAADSDMTEVPGRNIVAGRELLEHYGFKLAAEHTGGYGSRVLVFELWSGDVWIRRGHALAVAAA